MCVENILCVVAIVSALPLMTLFLYMFDDKKGNDGIIKWWFKNYGWKAIKQSIKDYIDKEKEETRDSENTPS